MCKRGAIPADEMAAKDTATIEEASRFYFTCTNEDNTIPADEMAAENNATTDQLSRFIYLM
jgi:hypothetical protein